MCEDYIKTLLIKIDNREIIKQIAYEGNKDFENKINLIKLGLYNAIVKRTPMSTINLGILNAIYSAKIIILNQNDKIYLSILKENNSKYLFPLNENEQYLIEVNPNLFNLDLLKQDDSFNIESYPGTGVYIERSKLLWLIN